MTVIGFHCSHEQIAPGTLLRDVQHAEQAGFTAAHVVGPPVAVVASGRASPASRGPSSVPPSPRRACPFGVVTAPGQRYHPAITAQAIATLASMFPGRFWAALGSGEASNERVTGEAWPRKDVRDARLLECVDVIRRLLAGEEVDHDGLVTVNRAPPVDAPGCRPAPHRPRRHPRDRRPPRRLGRRPGHRQPAARHPATRCSTPTATPAAEVPPGSRCT